MDVGGVSARAGIDWDACSGLLVEWAKPGRLESGAAACSAPLGCAKSVLVCAIFGTADGVGIVVLAGAVS